jgi:hypothetical protein
LLRRRRADGEDEKDEDCRKRRAHGRSRVAPID